MLRGLYVCREREREKLGCLVVTGVRLKDTNCCAR